MSKAGLAIIGLLLSELLSMLGVQIDAGTIEGGVNGLFTFVSLGLLIWGQVDRPDLRWGLLRK